VPRSPADKRPPPNNRASPEAVAKRRAARAFNEAVLGQGSRGPDGRTERRRRRLLQELADGRTSAGRELTPIDVLLCVQALLDLGEPLATLLEARPAPEPLPVTDELVERVRALDEAYTLAPEVYRFVGVGDAALSLACVDRPKRGPVKAAPRPSSATRRGAA
jgi:hypothetical protein